MRFLLVLGLIFSFNALAVEWNDLEAGKSYKLTQSFQLPQTERSGSILDFTAGEEVKLIDVIQLEINVVIYQLKYAKCPGPAMTTEMEIIPVHGTSPVVEVGAQLVKDCELQIFIENKDLLTQSLLK
jgi:hypothetical protein